MFKIGEYTIEARDIATVILVIVMMYAAFTIRDERQAIVTQCRQAQQKVLDENCQTCTETCTEWLIHKIWRENKDYNIGDLT